MVDAESKRFKKFVARLTEIVAHPARLTTRSSAASTLSWSASTPPNAPTGTSCPR